MAGTKVARVTFEFTTGETATMDFDTVESHQSGTSGLVPDGFHAVEDALSTAITEGGFWPEEGDAEPERTDFIVRFPASLMVRVENVDDEVMAESIASDLFRSQGVETRLTDAVEETDFWFDTADEPEAEEDESS